MIRSTPLPPFNAELEDWDSVLAWYNQKLRKRATRELGPIKTKPRTTPITPNQPIPAALDPKILVTSKEDVFILRGPVL